MICRVFDLIWVGVIPCFDPFRCEVDAHPIGRLMNVVRGGVLTRLDTVVGGPLNWAPVVPGPGLYWGQVSNHPTGVGALSRLGFERPYRGR